MVDFTAPGIVVENILRAVDAGVPSVVGTSGWDTGRGRCARRRAAGVAVFFAPNFALGAVLMMRFAREASRHFAAAEIIELHHQTKLDAPSGTALATAAAMEGDVPIHSVRLPGLVAHQEVVLGGRGETLTIRHDTTSREAFVPGVELALSKVARTASGRHRRPRPPALRDLLEDTIAIGELELSLLRPREPDALIDEAAFADDEFMPYWAELWPSGLALARALPTRLDGLRVVELGCGLGVPSLAAAARGAEVTAARLGGGRGRAPPPATPSATRSGCTSSTPTGAASRGRTTWCSERICSTSGATCMR